MKRFSIALLITVLLTGFFIVNAKTVVTIEKNEKGWVNDKIRFNAPDLLNNSIFMSEVEVKPYDINGDSFSLAWNYSMNALVNENEYDYIQKDLHQPLIGGEISMFLWIREGAGVDSSGYRFELYAYEPDATEHLLTKTGALGISGQVPSGRGDPGWHEISASLPSEKKIVRVKIMMTCANDNKTCWGVVNIDEIKFKDTSIAEYTRLDEANFTAVERTSETPTLVSGTLDYLYEGTGVLVLSGGVTPDLEYLKQIAIESVLDLKVDKGFFEYKLFVDAFNSSLDGSPHMKTYAICYDKNGNEYILEPSVRIKYGAFFGAGFVFAGYNQFRAELPHDIEISKVRIVIEWVENGGMGPVPYYIDDIKIIENDIDIESTLTENAKTNDKGFALFSIVVILFAFSVLKKRSEIIVKG